MFEKVHVLLNQFNISTRIFVLVAILFFGMLWLSGQKISENWEKLDSAQDLVELAELGTQISALAHEMQRERGISAGFLSSGGNNFADRLPVQRRRTDEARQTLEDALRDFHTEHFGQGLVRPLTEGTARLSELAARRDGVSRLGTSVPEMAGYYTGTINGLIRVVEVIPSLVTEADIASTVAGYLNMIHAKESAGLERATGAAGFGAGQFTNAGLGRSLELIGEQEAYFSSFALYDNHRGAELIDQVLSSTDAVEVERLRQIAISSIESGQLGGVDAGHWFDSISGKIELLAELEVQIAADLTGLAASHESEGRDTLVMVSAVYGSLLVLMFIFAVFVARGISVPIRSITQGLAQMAKGDHNITLPSLDRKDEIGAMARALSEFKGISVGADRAQAALNGASANFMIADANHDIVYVNSSAIEMFRTAEADLRRDLPNFNTDTLVGTSIDTFHKNPAHQRRILEGLTGTHSGRIEVGGRTFVLTVTPALNSQGEPLGAAVEWKDMTQELAIEGEVGGLVQAATDGDFTQRLEEDGKAGFMLELSRGMNSLVDTVDWGLSETVKIMAALAEGDLTQRMDGEYHGSFLRLKRDANRMAEKFAEIAGGISDSTNAVKSATEEITAGAADLSSRTEQQASSLEETSASMEELSATVRQNADNAQQANQLAAAARDGAAGGGAVVTSAVEAMGQIEESSKKITEIVGMIDEIAFQTNLLALNAAVEAARAGEAGKGFAVVATGVRALAQRSGQASKEIKELITTSDNQVSEGVGLVKQTGVSLEEIVTSVKKVADIVSDIAAASQEQSTGIDEVSTAVTNMDEMTQQNAALVEETTAALQSAQNQVGDLNQLVAFFKTGREGGIPDHSVPLAVVASNSEPKANPKPKADPKPKPETATKKVASGGGAAADDDEWQEF